DDNLGVRFPDMSNVYSKRLQEIALRCAKDIGYDLKTGVYLAVSGPSYETKAEVQAFKLLGADVVGMSTVPEAIVSNYLGMETLGFSLVTNHATGVCDTKLSHKEVIETGKAAQKTMVKLVLKIIEKL
ncbi:purine-nucleoside phosphorylase, partial [bacterium]|nr:purine-nucleoside phosphorylase [bacterium]